MKDRSTTKTTDSVSASPDPTILTPGPILQQLPDGTLLFGGMVVSEVLGPTHPLTFQAQRNVSLRLMKKYSRKEGPDK